MQKNHFLSLKKWKNNQSVQLCSCESCLAILHCRTTSFPICRKTRWRIFLFPVSLQWTKRRIWKIVFICRIFIKFILVCRFVFSRFFHWAKLADLKIFFFPHLSSRKDQQEQQQQAGDPRLLLLLLRPEDEAAAAAGAGGQEVGRQEGQALRCGTGFRMETKTKAKLVLPRR